MLIIIYAIFLINFDLATRRSRGLRRELSVLRSECNHKEKVTGFSPKTAGTTSDDFLIDTTHPMPHAALIRLDQVPPVRPAVH